LLIIGALAVPAGLLSGFFGLVFVGDRSVAQPFQVAAMVLIFGGLFSLVAAFLFPSGRQRIERATRDL
jgi:hypothetical protein